MRKILLTLLLSQVATAQNHGPLEERLKAGIAKLLPSVISVTSSGSHRDSFGSGFIIDSKKGWILTNYHVIAQVRNPRILLNDTKKTISSEVIFHDSKKDLALLQVMEKNLLPPSLNLAAEMKLHVGQFVIAAGNPGGFSFSASMGIISALNRVLPDQFSDMKYIQVDAPMYHGSSGGPLTNLKGDVIGMVSRGGANGAAGFAITAREIASFLEERTKTKKKNKKEFFYLGAVLQPLTKPFRDHYKWKEQRGVLVADVYPGSAAEEAGLKSGDIVQSIGRLDLVAETEVEITILENHISSLDHESQELLLTRDSSERTLEVSLKKHPPCKTSAESDSKVSYSSHRENNCYWVPSRDFVEIKRFWPSRRFAHVSPKAGDLLISQTHSTPPSELLRNLDHSSELRILGTVIRQGKPRLILLPSKKKEKN